jgi:hypothetical protein
VGFGDGGLPSHGVLIAGSLPEARVGEIAGYRGARPRRGIVGRRRGGDGILISVAAYTLGEERRVCVVEEAAARSTEIRSVITEH